MPAQRTKQRRTTQACDFCHSRGRRCIQNTEQSVDEHRSCTTCAEYGETCTWSREPQKRGTKPGNTSGLRKATAWKQRILRDKESISSLLDVYLDTIHPVFPLYCERELWVGWKESTFPASPSQYTSLLSMCALSAQHAQQGSLFEDQKTPDSLGAGADIYLREAEHLVLVQQPDVLDIELVRSCGFLALLGLQTGNRSIIHKYLGMYHSVCAQFSLHDESHWENTTNMSVCDLETRRRLYWAMYRLEVHSACVLGHMIRLPELQSNVNYPAGLHHPAFVSGRDGDFEDWFAGWNTTTDLYRILEHTIVDFRAGRRRTTNVKVQNRSAGDTDIQQRMIDIQQMALPQFDHAHERSADNGKNRCGFQATNILFTIHMIRMFTAEPTAQSMATAAVALLESVKRIPPEYIRANGARLLQEVAGTGLMLGTVAAKPSTSEEEVQRLYALQESLAAFLESSTLANGTTPALAIRLRRQMEQIVQRRANVDVTIKQIADPDVDIHTENWDEDIEILFGLDQFTSDTGIMATHFRPGLLIDPAWSLN